MHCRRIFSGFATVGLSAAVLFGPVAAASAHGSKHHKTTTTTKAKKPKKSSASSGTVSTTCPSATVISKATGSTYPAPKSQKAEGGLICNYNTPTSGANLVLSITPVPSSVNAAAVQGTAENQAKAEGVSASAVSGLGTVAYVDTLKDASTNSSGQATSILVVLDHSSLIDVTAEASPSAIEAVARYVLSH